MHEEDLRQIIRSGECGQLKNSEALIDVARRHPDEIPVLKEYLTDELLQTHMAEIPMTRHDWCAPPLSA
jgi:hypothetical protein